MKQNRLYLLLIFLLALALRLSDLGGNPAGFFRDEADKGYTTYCLVESGMDQDGKTYPLFVRSLNVTTSAVYQYIGIPFVMFFGLDEFSVRLPAALAGACSVLVAYGIGQLWWGGAAGLWAALFVCLSPWSLLLSRWANQSILLTFTVPLAVWLFTKDHAQKYPSTRNAFLSAIAFIVAFYCYETARLYIPLLLLLLTVNTLTPATVKTNGLKRVGVPLLLLWAVFSVGALPMAYHVLFESAQSSVRFSTIMIFRGQPFTQLIMEWTANYFKHLSPGFLFVSGDANLRHSTLVFGQLHWYIAPLLMLGLVRAFRRREWLDRTLLIWFFCFPVSAACTWEGVPHALRSIYAIPAAQVVAAYGMLEALDWKEKYGAKLSQGFAQTIGYLWIASVVLLPAVYLQDLYFRYPSYSAIHWEYGYKEAIEWWNGQKQPGDKTVVSGMAEYPYIFFLFYNQYPPERWIQDQSIEGITFIPRASPPEPYFEVSETRAFYLLRPDELTNYRQEKVITLPSDDPMQRAAVWKWVVVQKQ